MVVPDIELVVERARETYTNKVGSEENPSNVYNSRTLLYQSIVIHQTIYVPELVSLSMANCCHDKSALNLPFLYEQ